MRVTLAPEAQVVWAAGLFEGEGTIAIAVRRGHGPDTYRLVCSVTNTDRQVIDYFHERWHGWLAPMRDRPGRQPAWHWIVAGPTAEAFLNEVAPYFVTDRVADKAVIGLRLRDATGSIGQRDVERKARQRHLYERLRVLNQRGAAA